MSAEFNGDPDLVTLAEAKQWLREQVEDGAECPCCTQFAKVYPRPLPNASARVMIELYRRGEGRDWIHLPPILDTMKGTPHQGGYGTLAQFWGLIEPMPGQRDDGSKRVGWWRLTDRGRSFVRSEQTVPRKARIYNGRCLGFTGPPVTISDVLGERFDYRELMGWLP